MVFAKYLFCTSSRAPEVLPWTRRVAIILALKRSEALPIDLSSYFRNVQPAMAVASLNSQISSRIAQSLSEDTKYSSCVFGAYVYVISSGLDDQTVFRYDPPTALSPTLSHPIPSKLNPLSHVFSLAKTFQPLTVSIRLLPPDESPSSPSFLAGEVVPNDVGDDILAAACSGLISQLGKLKRMNLSWEDKVLFLKLYREKRG